MSLEHGPIRQVRVRVTPDGRVTRRDAAKFLGLEPKTLSNWALQGKGPKPVKLGGWVFYWLDELKRVVAEGI